MCSRGLLGSLSSGPTSWAPCRGPLCPLLAAGFLLASSVAAVQPPGAHPLPECTGSGLAYTDGGRCYLWRPGDVTPASLDLPTRGYLRLVIRLSDPAAGMVLLQGVSYPSTDETVLFVADGSRRQASRVPIRPPGLSQWALSPDGRLLAAVFPTGQNPARHWALGVWGIGGEAIGTLEKPGEGTGMYRLQGWCGETIVYWADREGGLWGWLVGVSVAEGRPREVWRRALPALGPHSASVLMAPEAEAVMYVLPDAPFDLETNRLRAIRIAPDTGEIVGEEILELDVLRVHQALDVTRNGKRVLAAVAMELPTARPQALGEADMEAGCRPVRLLACRPVHYAKYSPDGTYLAALVRVLSRHVILVLDVATGARLASLPLSDSDGAGFAWVMLRE